MIQKTLIFALSIVFLASCTNTEYKEGLTVSKIENGKIITTDGSKIPLRPKGYEDAAAVFFVRHAEAAEANELNEDNPGLTPEGEADAERLAAILQPAGIEEVMMTSRRRVIFTAKPLAMVHDLKVFTYNTQQYNRVVERVNNKHLGKNIVIYGHSNTTPELINLLIEEERYEQIPHDEYDNLFVVYTNGAGSETLVHKYKY